MFILTIKCQILIAYFDKSQQLVGFTSSSFSGHYYHENLHWEKTSRKRF
jgi:hypothetical protein